MKCLGLFSVMESDHQLVSHLLDTCVVLLSGREVFDDRTFSGVCIASRYEHP